MTLLRPGHNPPHVTIPAQVWFGSKKRFARGPASSKWCPGSTPISIRSGTRMSSLIVWLRVEAKRGSPRVGQIHRWLDDRRRDFGSALAPRSAQSEIGGDIMLMASRPEPCQVTERHPIVLRSHVKWLGKDRRNASRRENPEGFVDSHRGARFAPLAKCSSLELAAKECHERRIFLACHRNSKPTINLWNQKTSILKVSLRPGAKRSSKLSRRSASKN